MEIRDTVSAVIGRGHSIGASTFSPADTRGRADTQRPELVKGERAIRELLDHVLDAVEFGVPVGVGGFLPGLGALECDAAAGEQAAQGFPADPDRAAGDGAQVGGEFADRPAGEGLAEPDRASGGRCDDEVLVVSAEQAGTASRPLGVQAGQADLVEAVE